LGLVSCYSEAWWASASIQFWQMSGPGSPVALRSEGLAVANRRVLLITIARDLVQVPECRNMIRNLSPYIRNNIDARRRQFAVHSPQSTVRSSYLPRPRSAVAVPVGAWHEVMTVYNDRAFETDKERIKDWNDSLNTLLIFVRNFIVLFSALFFNSPARQPSFPRFSLPSSWKA
jgi:hypothetical protein